MHKIFPCGLQPSNWKIFISKLEPIRTDTSAHVITNESPFVSFCGFLSFLGSYKGKLFIENHQNFELFTMGRLSKFTFVKKYCNYGVLY